MIKRASSDAMPPWVAVGKKVAVVSSARAHGYAVEITTVEKTTNTQVVLADNASRDTRRFNLKTGLELMGHSRTAWGGGAPFLADPASPEVLDLLEKQRKDNAAIKADAAARAFAKERTMANAAEATLAFRKWILLEQDGRDKDDA